MIGRTGRAALLYLVLAHLAASLLAQGTLPPELQGCAAETQVSHPDEAVVQGFPSAPGAKVETAWCVAWEDSGKKGLRITGAWFKRKASEAWTQVLGVAGLVEVFVPYHSGDLRLYDLQWGLLKRLHAPFVGAPAHLLSSGQRQDIVVREVADRGIAWTSDHEIRRGEELRIWGVYDAGNYEYVIQYGFRDDGQITFRLGATGYNNLGVPAEGHMHTALWRIDVDLNGPGHDSAALTHHLEQDSNGQPTNAATDTDFWGAEEAEVAWQPLNFSTLRVRDEQRKNANGNPIGYELVPLRTGTARHVESFSHQDFRVTRYDSNEVNVEASQVPGFVSGQSIHDTDIVLWHTSATHHDPHDEDGRMTLLRESGFDLVPHNLFDTTPLVDTSCPASRLPGSFLQDWEIVKATSGFVTTVATALATCPAGKSLLGGGAQVLGVPSSGVSLTASYPFPFGPSANRWYAAARPVVPGSGVSWRLESYAICGRISGHRIVPVARSSNELYNPVAASCRHGEAVLGGGGGSFKAEIGLTSTIPIGPVCPAQWFTDARKVPRTDGLSLSAHSTVICGNVPGYEAVTASSARNSVGFKNASALCPAGKVVVGGGAWIVGSDENTVLRMSWPRSFNRPGDGWGAQAIELQANPGDWQLQVTAICACYPGPC